MDKRDAPSVDENDPASTAIELNPEKIDLQKKPARNGVGTSSGPELQTEPKLGDSSEST